jgi:hypothetical protein
MQRRNPEPARRCAMHAGHPWNPDMTVNSNIDAFARAEVKATLRFGDRVWLATEAGLCRRDPGNVLRPAGALAETSVQALGPAPGGMVAAAGGAVVLLDGAGAERGRRAGPAGEKIAAISAAADRILVGTKNGLFAAQQDRWVRLFGGPGCEVVGIHELPGRLILRIKKQGDQRRPALAESADAGATWTVTEMGHYGDVPVAADARTLVTRWHGAFPREGRRGGYKKHPITAAELGPDGSVLVVDGDKAEIVGPGRRHLEAFHPALAEAEFVHLLPDGILAAGVQGAVLFDPLRGSVVDLAEPVGADRRARLGKRKKLFALDDGAVLATCSFGTFLSTDAGATWRRVDAEWDVLDAEHIARAPDGRWFLLCQRGLFASRDNGARFDYVKPKLPAGARHYGEFRSLAIAHGTLWLGTKGGLFAAPLGDAERLAPVDAVPAVAVEALAARRAGTLLVGLEGRGLFAFDPASGRLDPLAPEAVHEARIVADGDRLLAAVEDRLIAVGAAVGDATPSAAEGALGIAANDGRVLVWDRRRAWIKRPGAGDWTALADWPEAARSAALLDRAVLVTDRARIVAMALPDAA